MANTLFIKLSGDSDMVCNEPFLPEHFLSSKNAVFVVLSEQVSAVTMEDQHTDFLNCANVYLPFNSTFLQSFLSPPPDLFLERISVKAMCLPCVHSSFMSSTSGHLLPLQSFPPSLRSSLTL